MGKITLVKSVPGLTEHTKDRLQQKGIHRLDDMSSRTVAEVWSLVVVARDYPFDHLISAMKASKAVFRDCDPRNVDLLGDDLEQLQLSTGTRNTLYRHGVRSIELMRRVGAQRLSYNVRPFGPAAIKELRFAFKHIGLELLD